MNRLVITAVDARADKSNPFLPARYAGPLAALTRIGEVKMTSIESMGMGVLRKAAGRKIDLLNVLDHGGPHFIEVGDDFLGPDDVERFRPQLELLRGQFAMGGMVHLQHCEAGQNDELLMALANVWQAKVKAGTGLHNPIYRVNLGHYRVCDGIRCWDEPSVISRLRDAG